MTRFVLDASFAVTWVVESERTPEGMRAFNTLKQQRAKALVPPIWPEEMANVLLTLERAKKLTSAQVTTWVDVFVNLPIEIEAASLKRSLVEVRLLAETHRLSAYDASYLHLAMRDGLPLATRDKQLLAASSAVGVRLVEDVN